MSTLKVGIASYKEMKARTMAVARGERRVAADEPKVWFTSTDCRWGTRHSAGRPLPFSRR
jgi:predicted transcriptional regulator